MPPNQREIQEGITNYVYIGTFIFLILAFLFILSLIISLQRRRRMIKEKQQLQVSFQQELLRTQLEIQEQTFKNISQEIHDNIGQVLSLAKLNISTMSAENSGNLNEKIVDTKNLLSKAIQDLRDLSRSLNTDYIADRGLLRSVEYELELMKRTGSCETNLVTEGKPYPIDPQKELILFRIFQEGMNNIIKHAKAKTVTVLLDSHPDHFILRLSDDGQGFLLNSIDNKGLTGLGIRNMQNRARLIGAHLDVWSEVNNGTVITLNVPV